MARQALRTSFESDGYDGVRGDTQWWFAAWGRGKKPEWTKREDAGRPPSPRELINAEYIVFGIRKHGRVTYKTRTGGMDFRRPRR